MEKYKCKEEELKPQRVSDYEKEKCCNCISWSGSSNENIDHSHCSDLRNNHRTISKEGNKEYDYCVYFRKKEN